MRVKASKWPPNERNVVLKIITAPLTSEYKERKRLSVSFNFCEGKKNVKAGLFVRHLLYTRHFKVLHRSKIIKKNNNRETKMNGFKINKTNARFADRFLPFGHWQEEF